MGVLVVPRLLIHRIHADHLQLAAVDLRGECGDHTPVLVLEEAAARRWEYDDGESRVAEREQFHPPAKGRTVPLNVFAAQLVSYTERLLRLHTRFASRYLSTPRDLIVYLPPG